MEGDFSYDTAHRGRPHMPFSMGSLSQWIVAKCKCLTKPKGQSESVYRRTDNAMAKRKKEKRTNTDLQNATQKTKDRATRTPIKLRFDSGAPER